jgi:hypothetical protein
MQFDSKSVVRHDARAVYSTFRSMGDVQSVGARAILIYQTQILTVNRVGESQQTTTGRCKYYYIEMQKITGLK